MRTINSLLQASEAVELPFLVENSLVETRTQYTDLQKEQLFMGKLSDGEEIQRIGAKYKGYAPRTIREKEKKGQPTDRVTLRDTGEFYFEVFADPRADGIVVGSADSKSEQLQEDYGPKIFGLSDDPKQQYINQVRPELVKQMTDQLNKK